MRGPEPIAKACDMLRRATLAIAIFVGLISCMPFNVAAQTTRTYTSPRFHYHFDFPARYVVDPDDLVAPADPNTQIPAGTDAFGDGVFGGIFGDVMIGKVTGPNAFDDAIDTWIAGTGEDDHYPDFLAFASDKAKMLCAADGPDESIDCTKLSRSRGFTTDSGLKGYEFYLVMRTARLKPKTVSTKVVGPFYAFDLSAQRPNGRSMALIITAPPLFPNHDPSALATIVRSLVIEQH